MDWILQLERIQLVLLLIISMIRLIMKTINVMPCLIIYDKEENEKRKVGAFRNPKV